jgi:hypothetical protein
MPQPQDLMSVQIVFERAPLLRLFFASGDCVDYPLRQTQLLLLAQQALVAFQLGERQR